MYMCRHKISPGLLIPRARCSSHPSQLVHSFSNPETWLLLPLQERKASLRAIIYYRLVSSPFTTIWQSAPISRNWNTTAVLQSSALVSYNLLLLNSNDLTSLDVQNDTSKLIFNSSELEISNIEVMHNHSMNTKDKPVSLVLDPDSERATVELPSKLHKGSTAVVQIKFRGPLTGSMTGYYRSSWKNEGKEQYYSLTQFQVYKKFIWHIQHWS